MLPGRAGRTIAVMTTTEPSESFQIPIEAAEAYEAAFVPAFFAQWAPILCDAAGIGAGHKVLDVACGTGIVARTAAERCRGGQVVGVDLNEAMLTVARRVRGRHRLAARRRRRAAAGRPLLRRRAVPDGPDVLPRPDRRPPGDGPRRGPDRDGRGARPGQPRRPARLRAIRRHGRPARRTRGPVPARTPTSPAGTSTSWSAYSAGLACA